MNATLESEKLDELRSRMYTLELEDSRLTIRWLEDGCEKRTPIDTVEDFDAFTARVACESEREQSEVVVLWAPRVWGASEEKHGAHIMRLLGVLWGK